MGGYKDGCVEKGMEQQWVVQMSGWIDR